NRFTEGNATSNAIKSQVALQAPIAAQSELQVRLSQIMGRSQVPPNLVNLRSFDEAESAGSLRQYNAELTFEKFSTKQLSDFIRELEQRERLKLTAFQI